MYPILRVARPTTDISALLPFYRDGLGFKIISQFNDHASFDGAMLGHDNAPYHLEFTKGHGASPSSIGSPSPEHLLVFYYPDKAEWDVAVKRMEDAGFEPVKPHNSYWEPNGRTYEDPDGYRVVLQQAAWEK
jgi:catechol 2,3-dioxygenase-like lactoylglutathione lyase family enzyme